MSDAINNFGQIDAALAKAKSRGRGTMVATVFIGCLSLVLTVTFGIAKTILLHGKMPIMGILILPGYALGLLLAVTGLTVGIVHLSLRTEHRRAALVGTLAAILASVYTLYSVGAMVFFYYMMFNSFLQGMQGSMM